MVVVVDLMVLSNGTNSYDGISICTMTLMEVGRHLNYFLKFKIMPYLGRELTSGNYLKLDDITSQFDGSTTTFQLKSGGSDFFLVHHSHF